MSNSENSQAHFTNEAYRASFEKKNEIIIIQTNIPTQKTEPI